jgi:L-alanine-DL-glutamate epimerase-like enolase superfamily enzyme
VIVTGIRVLCGTRLHSREDQWITDIYRSVKADIAVVVVTTDSDIVGVGEACSYGNPLQISEWVQWYAPTLIGRDLNDFWAVPQPNGTSLDHAVSSAHDFAVAGIDCALWDARAKEAGVPVSQLLNPAADKSVKVYASGGVRYDWRADPITLVDDVVSYVEQGYDTVKFRIGTAWKWDSVTPERFLSLVDQVRREVGDSVGLAVDANSRLTREEAGIVAFGLQDRGALWLEEPLAKDDLEGYVHLNSKLEMPISGGESFTSTEQFRKWLERGAFDIVQPDAGVCGISEVMRIGALAARYGVELIPHSWHNGLMLMANASCVAALPNSSLVEECMVQGPLRWGSLVGGTRVHNGSVNVDVGPGFGVQVIEDLEEQFPYVEGHYSVEVFR